MNEEGGTLQLFDELLEYGDLVEINGVDINCQVGSDQLFCHPLSP